ncbi:hypothetical protein Tco_0685481 [Tanacetum coccineum]
MAHTRRAIMEEHRASKEAYRKVHNETVRSGLRMAIMQQSMEMDMCLVDAKVFQKILYICPRVKGVDFAEVPDDEATLTFLLNLGYKGPLHKHPNMYVDNKHQPWTTLAAIINKCLSGKATSNDSLSKSKIDILWGMFYRENVNYLELIWEDLAFQMGIQAACLIGSARIMTESVPEPARRRPSGIAFRDTSSVTKKLSPDPSQKLKGVLTLTPEEKLAANMMKALKESKKTSRRQPGTGGSSKGTGSIPGVPDESTVVPTTSSEGTDAEKTKEVKDDTKKAEFPPSSSSLSVSSGFGDQFLKISSDTSLIGTIKDTTDAEINSLLDPSVLTTILETPSAALATTVLPPPTVSTFPPAPLQSTIPISTPPITIEAPQMTTILDPLHTVIQRVYVLEKDVQDLKEADNTTTLHALIKSKLPSAIHAFLGSSLGDELH